MKRFIPVFLFLLTTTGTQAQKINGQWRGYFNNNGNITVDNLAGGQNTEYVLEIEVDGNTVSGYSYTYFEGRKYFVICSVVGSYDKQTKTIIAHEKARIKGFTPPGWADCLQTHTLTYSKEDGKEILEGAWRTSPYDKDNNCGIGSTTLSRKLLTKTILSNNSKSIGRTPPKKNTLPVKIPSFEDKNKTKPPVVKNIPKPQVVIPPVVKKNTIEKKDDSQLPVPNEKKDITKTNPANPEKFEKRNTSLIKTIEVEQETFRVDLYDNGEIDGDSISLFYNGKLLLSHQRLDVKAISLTLKVDESIIVNELTMYAENLGEIPPNTALMVVTDGDNRYEVHITSDLKQSGTIRFIHPKKQ